MANRFDLNRPQNFQYTSQYVPMPLEAISHMASQYSDRYHKGRAIPNQLDLLASKIQAAPMNYDLKNQFLKDAHTKMDALVQNAKPEDWANPQFQDKTQNTLNEILADPRLSIIDTNKKYFDSHKPDKNDLDFTYERVPTQGTGSHITGYKQTSDVIADGKITPFGNTYESKAKIMDGIAKSGYMKDSGIDYNNPIRVGANGEYEAYTGTTKGWVGISRDKVKQVSDVSADLYGPTKEGKYETQKILRDEYNLGNKAYDYDYDKLKYLAQKDPNSPEAHVFNNIKTRFGQDLFNTGIKQIGDITTSKIENKELLNKQKVYDINHPQDPSFDTLGSIEGNVSTTPVNTKDALVNLGFNKDLIDDDGNINYGSGKLGVDPNKRSPFNPNGFTMNGTKENQQKANDYYGSLVSTANNLGINIKDFTFNGKINYDNLKNKLVEIGKNIGKEATNSQELQAGLKKDLSKNYFGELSQNGFKASPLVQKMKIYENGNSSKTVENTAEKMALAENAIFVGLDFNDPNNGSVTFTATKGEAGTEPGLYNGILPDERLKTLMKPIHSFTQGLNNAAAGKITPETSKANVKEASEALVTLCNKIINSNDPNGETKIQKLIELGNGMNSVDAKSRVIVGHNVKGDKLLIGTVKYDDNNKPIKKIIEVDMRTGMVSESDLGKIQNEESSVIQRMIAPGFNTAAKGYENKEIDYED